MAWIPSHQELRDHPKTKRLRRSLGVGLPQTIGHLHMLWWWALDYAEDGRLSKWTAEDIADASGWDDDAHQFVDALVSAGFLNRDGDVLTVHDWDEYLGRLLDKRRKNAERQRRARGVSNQSEEDTEVRNAPVTRDNEVNDSNVDDSHRATEQNTTEQERTQEPPLLSPPEGDHPKRQFAEHVRLTEAEYQKLVADYGEFDTRRMIEILDNYKGAKGKRYKSDYRAILNWVVERLEEEKAKRSPPATSVADNHGWGKEVYT